MTVKKIAEKFIQIRTQGKAAECIPLKEKIHHSPAEIGFHGYIVSIFHAYQTPEQCAYILVDSDSQDIDKAAWQDLPPREALFAMAFELLKNDVWQEILSMLEEKSPPQSSLKGTAEQLEMFGVVRARRRGGPRRSPAKAISTSSTTTGVSSPIARLSCPRVIARYTSASSVASEQRAVERAMRIVDLVALAERVERVLPSRVQLARGPPGCRRRRRRGSRPVPARASRAPRSGTPRRTRRCESTSSAPRTYSRTRPATRRSAACPAGTRW